MRRPNIVLIMADDMGYECPGCYGSISYKTPMLDKLADQGIRFDHCYSTPLCTPSRVQIMTGRYNFRNYEGFAYLNPEEYSFANLLKEAGYKTCISGKWQLGGGHDRVKNFGFDDYNLWNMGNNLEDQCENTVAGGRYAHPLIYRGNEFLDDIKIENEYGPDICCDYLLNFIKENKEEPFFAYYPMLLVHDPFCPTPDSPEWENYERRDENDTKYFKDMVEYTDKLVGRIINTLEELDLLDNTLVIFTGDNGTPHVIETKMKDGSVVGGKGTMLDAGTHVPLIAYWKGNTPEGEVLDNLVDFSDIFPTFAEMADILPPEEIIIDGNSFYPQICGEEGTSSEWVFCHYDPQVPWMDWQKNAGRFAREHRYKLYQNGEFFDVKNDPLEKENIKNKETINDEAIKVKKKLKKVLDSMPAWKEEGAKFRCEFSKEEMKDYSKYIKSR